MPEKMVQQGTAAAADAIRAAQFEQFMHEGGRFSKSNGFVVGQHVKGGEGGGKGAAGAMVVARSNMGMGRRDNLARRRRLPAGRWVAAEKIIGYRVIFSFLMAPFHYYRPQVGKTAQQEKRRLPHLPETGNIFLRQCGQFRQIGGEHRNSCRQHLEQLLHLRVLGQILFDQAFLK